MTANMVPRESLQGVTTTGLPVYKDSHGGEPFYYKDGVKTVYRGAIVPKAEGINLNPDAAPAARILQDRKAINASIQQQEKQAGSMGSFVRNIDKQVNRFEQIAKDLSSADARLLNLPIRALRGSVAGSPLQAKVDMYVAEISSETGKLATGSTGSVAELSQSAREKWEKIHDPNLSMSDLLDRS